MELYKIIESNDGLLRCIIKITGNSRFRILNDYENSLINKKYISCNFEAIFLEIINPNINDYYMNISQNTDKVNKFYIKFEYNYTKCPIVCGIWDFDSFTPYHVIYPIHKILNKTSKLFHIVMKIDKKEMHKNDNILYDEYNDYKIQRNISITKLNSKLNNNNLNNKLGSPPNIINRYGKIINIGKNNKNFSCPKISEILDYNAYNNISIDDINNFNNVSIDDIKEEANTNTPENTLFEVVDKDLMDLQLFGLDSYDLNNVFDEVLHKVLDEEIPDLNSFDLEADY